MYCKYCGKKIPKNSKFCTFCGKKQLIDLKLDIESSKNKFSTYNSILESNHISITSKVVNSILEVVVSILILINFFSGIIGGLWLAFSGGISLVVYGIIISIVMPWVYTIVFIPQMALMPLLSKFSEKGNILVTSILGFLNLIYTNTVLAFWTVFVIANLVIDQNHSLIPLILWGYSTVMAPLSYMASKEPPDSIGTSMGLIFAQISYILLTILYLSNNYDVTKIYALGILILLFSSINVFLLVKQMTASRVVSEEEFSRE